jgi:hypothetical protein
MHPARTDWTTMECKAATQRTAKCITMMVRLALVSVGLYHWQWDSRGAFFSPPT